MEKEQIGLVIEAQRNFFASGKTFDVKHRIDSEEASFSDNLV